MVAHHMELSTHPHSPIGGHCTISNHRIIGGIKGITLKHATTDHENADLYRKLICFTQEAPTSVNRTTPVQSTRNAKRRERRQALAAARKAATESGAEPTSTEDEEEPNGHHHDDQVSELGSTTEDEPALKAPDAHTDKYEEAETQDKDKQPAKGKDTQAEVEDDDDEEVEEHTQEGSRRHEKAEKAATTRRVQVPVKNKITKRARQISEIVKAMRKEGQKTLHAYFK